MLAMPLQVQARDDSWIALYNTFWHKANNFNILIRGRSNVEAVPTCLEFDAWFEKYRYNFLNTS